MAVFLPEECLVKIFMHCLENLSDDGTSTKTIHPFTLVSKHWCVVSTPLLYSHPFSASEDDTSFFMLIRTLISCVPELFSSPATPKFNYIKYIRELILNENYFDMDKISSYDTSFFLPDVSNHDTVDSDQFVTSVIATFINHLFKNCDKLRKLEIIFSEKEDNIFFNNIIESLNFNNFDGESALSNLKNLHCSHYINSGNNNEDLYSSFSKEIQNLHHLSNKGLNSNREAESLSRLISNQKSLKHITLSETGQEKLIFQLLIEDFSVNKYNVVFKSLPTQSESLRILEFEKIYVGNISMEAINSLCSLKHINELKLNKCYGIVNNEIISWAKSMKELNCVEISDYTFTAVSERFLISLIQSSCHTLTEFKLNGMRDPRESGAEFFSEIPIRLPSLKRLELPKLTFDEFMSIIKSCTQLTFISIILDRELWKRDFKNLVNYLPNQLQTLEFREMDKMFGFDKLEYFFEKCQSRNINELKIISITGKFNLEQEYFELAKKFDFEMKFDNNKDFYYLF
jgi:hypothetical protein